MRPATSPSFGLLRPFLVLAVAALALAWGPLAAACPVCFGEAEAPVIDGVRWAIVFMAVLVYGLIGGGIALFLVLRRRSAAAADPRRGLPLVSPAGETESART